MNKIWGLTLIFNFSLRKLFAFCFPPGLTDPAHGEAVLSAMKKWLKNVLRYVKERPLLHAVIVCAPPVEGYLQEFFGELLPAGNQEAVRFSERISCAESHHVPDIKEQRDTFGPQTIFFTPKRELVEMLEKTDHAFNVEEAASKSVRQPPTVSPTASHSQTARGEL